MKNNSFIHEHALCESQNIGDGTRIWAFVHILPNAKIGKNCNICDGVFIENDVIVGNNVTIKCGVQLWDGVVLEDDVFVGPNVTFSNDLFPRSRQYPDKFLKTTICSGASIGANATILPNITIGRNSMIGAGAVVTKDVPPHAVVIGNPAKIINYRGESFVEENFQTCHEGINEVDLGINNCSLWTLPYFDDMRGSLMVADFGDNLPFKAERVFFVHNVPNDKVRGEHAHKKCDQFLIAVSGRLSVVLDNGVKRTEVLLDSSSKGLYLPAGVWGIQYKFSQNAILCVFASHSYDSDDYIREYSEFLNYVDNEK